MGERRRLGVQDALWLEMDRPTNLMVVDSLVWTATPIDRDRFIAVARERMWDRYPVFRSIAVQADDGHWYWEEQPDVDVEAHVEQVNLPPPGDARALQAFVSSQRTVPLDRDRPLWQIFLVDGYRGGTAMLSRTHHAIADGIRMVELAMSLFDASPDGGAIIPPPSLQRTAATVAEVSAPVGARLSEVVTALPARATELALDATVRTVRTSLGRSRRAITNPVGAAHSAATLAGAAIEDVVARTRGAIGGRGPLVDVFSAGPGDVDIARKLLIGTRNDVTCWTGDVGTNKAVAWSEPLPLADVKEVARATRATVNDVLVTCVAGTLHRYLDERAAVCSSVTWMVPVNLKPLDPTLPDELGNSFAIVQLELPTDIGDPLAVLGVVRRRMGRIKRGHEAAIAFRIQEVISGMGRTIYQASVDLLANRAIGVLTNVPGPPATVYLAGERVEGIVGWAPLSGNQPMSFTIYTYDGKVFVGIACDTDLVPDHEHLVDGFAAAFHRLQAAVA